MSETTQTPEPSFGSWIKQLRLDRKVSLEEIAAVTKVHIAQLRMIEEDEWKDLPASAFVRGFLVCYSRHLELDEVDVLRRYKIAMGARLKTIEAALPEGHHGVYGESRPRIRVASTPNFQKSPGAREVDVKASPTFTPRKIGIGAGLLALIAGIALLISLGRKSEPTQVAETPVAEENHPIAVPDAAVNSSSARTPPVAPVPAPQYHLELVGVEESWVNVKIGDQNAQGFSLKPGEHKNFTITPSAQLVLSNAGAVEIRWDGKSYASPGFRGDVKTLQLPAGLAALSEKKNFPRKVIAPRKTAPAPEASPAPPPTPAPESSTPAAR